MRDAKMVETCIVKEKQDYKQKLKTLKIEVNKLKGKEETSCISSWAHTSPFEFTSLCD